MTKRMILGKCLYGYIVKKKLIIIGVRYNRYSLALSVTHYSIRATIIRKTFIFLTSATVLFKVQPHSHMYYILTLHIVHQLNSFYVCLFSSVFINGFCHHP